MTSFEEQAFAIGNSISLPDIDSEHPFKVLALFRGGMGVCVKIENIATHEIFALKGMLHQHLHSKESRLRFLKEMSIWLAASSCDGVVCAHSIICYNGLLYVVARWIGNGDLRQAERLLTSKEKVRIIVEVADTLRLINEKYGVVHRDLKPENILLDESNRALVSDLGLAKAAIEDIPLVIEKDNVERIDLSITQNGVCMGTCLYMAPEQCRDASSVDVRADIYSLGCMLYEMETGSPPFVGDTALKILKSHLYAEPPKVGGFLKKTNLGVERVIAKCLRKNKEERYQTYDAFIADLLCCAQKRFGRFVYTKAKNLEERCFIGQGYSHLINIVDSRQNNGVPQFWMDFSTAQPILGDADHLMSLGNYKEAIKILGFFAVPQSIKPNSKWHFGCDIVERLAHALFMDGDMISARGLYGLLSKCLYRPSTFFVNASQMLINLNENTAALAVADEGLANFHEDTDLLGNRTLVLLKLQRLDEALTNATRRVKLYGNTQDAHLELNDVLAEFARKQYYRDISAWEQTMKYRCGVLSNAMRLGSLDARVMLSCANFFAEFKTGVGLHVLGELIAKNHFVGKWHDIARVHYARLTQKHYGTKSLDERVRPINVLREAITAYANSAKETTVVPMEIYYAYMDAYYSLSTITVELPPESIEILIHYYANEKMIDSRGEEILRHPIQLAHALTKKAEFDKAFEVLSNVPKEPLFSDSAWKVEIPYRTPEWYRICTILFIECNQLSRAEEIALQGVNEFPANVDALDTLLLVLKKQNRKGEISNLGKKADELFEAECDASARVEKVSEGLIQLFLKDFRAGSKHI